MISIPYNITPEENNHLLDLSIKLVEICHVANAVPFKVGIFEYRLSVRVHELVHIGCKT